MDTKLLLIQVITLLFLESLTATKKGNQSSRALAQKALDYVKPPEAAVLADFSRDPSTKLRDILVWMLHQPENHKFERKDLLQRLKLATIGDEYIYDAASTYIAMEQTPDECKKVIETARNDVNTFINKSILTGVLKESYYSAAFKPETVDWSNFAKETIALLEPFKTLGEMDKSTLIDSVDFSNPEALANALKLGLSNIKPEGIIKFGWQGFNRLFGEQGGARRGEFIVIGALQHNFKSGTALELVKSAALYNRPHMVDPTKKPLLLRYSFENSLIIDIMHLYKSMIEPEIGTKVDMDSIDPIVAATYIHERLSVNGYTVKIEHHNPSDVTIFKLFNMIEEWENKGYEIHMLNLDYLAMISTKGCKQGATGQDIRDLYRRLRNFTAAKEILTTTPHQLSVDAKKKTREGVELGDFVREIANKGYYDSCSTIDQEVDMEIYQHLVVINGETYITWQRGKHRKAGNPTPFEDLYTVYKFGEVGYIPDDVLGPDMSRKKVAARAISEGGQNPYWDME